MWRHVHASAQRLTWLLIAYVGTGKSLTPIGLILIDGASLVGGFGWCGHSCPNVLIVFNKNYIEIIIYNNCILLYNIFQVYILIRGF